MYCPVSTGGLSAGVPVLGVSGSWQATVALRAVFAAKLSCDSLTVSMAPAQESGVLIHAEVMAGTSARSASCAAMACSSSSFAGAASIAILAPRLPGQCENVLLSLTSTKSQRWASKYRKSSKLSWKNYPSVLTYTRMYLLLARVFAAPRPPPAQPRQVKGLGTARCTGTMHAAQKVSGQ